MCVNKQQLSAGPNYLLKNKRLACDALTIIEQIQIQLELQLKVDIKTLDNTDFFRLHSDKDDATSDEWLSFSSNLFLCLTNKCYSDGRDELINMPSVNQAIPNIDKKFRTKYYCTKETDETVEEIIIHKGKEDGVRKRKRTAGTVPTDQEITESMNLINAACVSVKEELESNSNIKLEFHELRYSKINRRKKELEERAVRGALVKGGRQGWITTIFERHSKLLGFQKYKGSVIDINSIDSAEHHSAVVEPLNMISYNMELFNKQLQDLESAKLTTASSSNIFTYQQVMGDENARNVLPLVEKIFQERKEVRDNANVIFKDMFDGPVKYQQFEVSDIKMLQILLGTVYWQREKGSCIFCKCNKRVGVNYNQTYVCTPITDDEHLSYYHNKKSYVTSLHS